jgi:hypothetical protein
VFFVGLSLDKYNFHYDVNSFCKIIAGIYPKSIAFDANMTAVEGSGFESEINAPPTAAPTAVPAPAAASIVGISSPWLITLTLFC